VQALAAGDETGGLKRARGEGSEEDSEQETKAKIHEKRTGRGKVTLEELLGGDQTISRPAAEVVEL
jgi:hypothetical protein